MIENRARRFARLLLLSGAAWIGCLACGPVKPVLPRSAVRGPLPPGDALAGAALLHDRRLGRSGFACADCHPVDAPRPGPSLAGVNAAGIDWCVERFQRRPPLAAQAIADVLAVPPKAIAPLPAEGAAIYAQQCAGCHEAGPAGGLLGQPWPTDRLVAVIRGTDRPRHPDTMMPAFSPDALNENALKRLVEYVVSKSAARGQAGMSAREMMVGSRR